MYTPLTLGLRVETSETLHKSSFPSEDDRSAGTAAGGYREESRRDDLLEMTLLQILIIPSLSLEPMPLGELNWESGRPLLAAQRNIRPALCHDVKLHIPQ